MEHKEKNNHATAHIIQSLFVNSLIVVAKGFAAFMTKSGAMLAETIHSFADCSNQVLLLFGVKQSRKPADEAHPFGYGKSVYFWSFMVAMLLFSIGGMFSIYEGVHKFNNPEPVHAIGWGIGVLVFSIILEGFATYKNIIELKKRKGDIDFFKYLKQTKDSDLIVIFGENSAAVLGLIIALIAMLTTYFTGDGRYDAAGSLAIGFVLIAVAIFLSVEVKSLLIGESGDVKIYEIIGELITKNPEIESLINCKTIQQGPGEVLVCLKIKCIPNISTERLSLLINTFENELRTARKDVKWIYVEPDLQEWK
ncbi:cation diffusion facilitator family transporter [Flavobacterium sp.]|uniref:cation diffusion facilitator family transporter n=1 Tax=Flavobacterium sp. TaxID=239 RepID=UPI00374FFCB7